MLRLVHGISRVGIKRSSFRVKGACFTANSQLKSIISLHIFTRSESVDNHSGINNHSNTGGEQENTMLESNTDTHHGDDLNVSQQLLERENASAHGEDSKKARNRKQNRNHKSKSKHNRESGPGSIPNHPLTGSPRSNEYKNDTRLLESYMRNDYVKPDMDTCDHSPQKGTNLNTKKKRNNVKQHKFRNEDQKIVGTPGKGDHITSGRDVRTPVVQNGACLKTTNRRDYEKKDGGENSSYQKGTYSKSPHNTNQRNKLPHINFEPYISQEKCSKGLKGGHLLMGVLRINPKKYQDAFIDGVPGERDINIDGIERRNRALPGDIVAVEILPEEQWKKAPEKEGLDHQNESLIARTGKVVYIIENKHSRVAAGHLNPFKNHAFGFALFSPVDNRLPRLMIPLNECPSDFKVKPKDFEKTLFVANITNWGLNMAFATGKLMRSLGEAGLIEPETEAIILSNNIDSSEFQKDVIDCLPEAETWKITKDELGNRKDFRDECIFTIDPATARDLDDALSCKKIGDDLYEVGVHIADVSHFIDQGNALDKVAQNRATSVYLAQRVIPMLPRVLCEQLCSLNPGVDRLAYSVVWNIKSDGTVLKEWFGRSVIRSCVKLSYDHAQQMLDCPDVIVDDEYPPIHGNFTLNKIAGIVGNLFKISSHLRTKRFDSGALKIDMPKLAFSLDNESGLPNGFRVYDYKDSNKLIEEFMLLANMAVGRKIYAAHPKEAILRLHPAPHEIMMEDLKNLCKQFDIPFDISDSASINKSLHAIAESYPELKDYMYPALTLMCAKPFQNAKYFCTGSIDDESLYRHYALNVPIYTHFTSPIRRYPDVLVHRLLTASLDRNFKINGTVKELQSIADHCNDKKWASKKASEQSSLLFFAVYVKECGPLTEKGVVVGILDKAIDVLSTRLGTVNRVYCDQLSLRNFEFKLDELKPRMTLHWQDIKTKTGSIDEKLAALTKQFEKRWEKKKESAEKLSDDNGAESSDDVIMQELTIFSPVEIILRVNESAPTKIVATIVNPFENNENPEHGL